MLCKPPSGEVEVGGFFDESSSRLSFPSLPVRSNSSLVLASSDSIVQLQSRSRRRVLVVIVPIYHGKHFILVHIITSWSTRFFDSKVFFGVDRGVYTSPRCSGRFSVHSTTAVNCVTRDLWSNWFLTLTSRILQIKAIRTWLRRKCFNFSRIRFVALQSVTTCDSHDCYFDRHGWPSEPR